MGVIESIKTVNSNDSSYGIYLINSAETEGTDLLVAIF